MDAKIARGNLWKIPVSGNIISVTGADVATILTAASGLAKNIFKYSAGAIGVATGLVSLFALLLSKAEEKVSWTTLSQIDSSIYKDGTKNRRLFKGVCITENIEMSCGDYNFTIPVEWIKNYNYNKEEKLESIGGLPNRKIYIINAKVKLFDDSIYKGVLTLPKKFEFLTPLGVQEVNIIEEAHYINGATITEIERLKSNINGFLDQKSKSLASLIGEENFKKFFLQQE